ncbi:MAG: FAD-binding protein [Xanthobacteraceae bacterium]
MASISAIVLANKTAPSIPAWLICDAAFLGKYGISITYPGHRNPGKFVESGYLVSARTLDELAGKIAADPAQLRNTIARYNGLAGTGVDIDFGKGETELNRFNGDVEHKPNPCVGPVATPPFYALAVWPADIAVSTGLATDANARVLGDDGKPIPGLYACGNDMASVMAGSYPGPGTTLSPATCSRTARRCTPRARSRGALRREPSGQYHDRRRSHGASRRQGCIHYRWWGRDWSCHR